MDGRADGFVVREFDTTEMDRAAGPRADTEREGNVRAGESHALVRSASVTIADELGEVLHEEVARHQAAGSAAGIVVGDECFTAATGVTNVEAPSPVDAATLFQVASITKTFTAAAVALLVEAGSLGFDDPVSKHLSELGAATGLDLDAMTVAHLLTHQGGFDGDHLFVERETEALEALRDARRFFAPGTGYSYNNAAFSIAGAVIEAASGQAYESFVRERLLRPLELKSACFRADDAITYGVAAPHLVIGDQAAVLRRAGWQPGWELGPVDRAAGGLIASVEHLLAWARFQWTGCGADGTELLSRSALDHLHTPVVRATRDAEIAFDWEVRRTNGVTTIEHGGLTVGYCSDLVVAPERRVGFVGLTNATNGAAVNQAVRRWALERVAGIREADDAPDPSITVDPARVAGRYLSAFALLTVTAGEAPGTLLISGAPREDTDGWKPPPEPPTTFAFYADDHAVSLDAPGPARVARFGYDARGQAEWMQWGSRRSPRVA
jgi:CubicO group peptidase (beta-lactamase class C family)